MSEIEDFLKGIENVDLDEKYSYERIILMFEVGKIVLPTLTYKILKNKIVFRSRENETVNLFNSINDLACPPKEFVKNYNRVNRPFQSMFYCADSRETSYSEFMADWIEKPKGSIFNVTIGRWRILEDLNVIIFQDRQRICDEFKHIKGDIWDKDNNMTNDFLVSKFSQSAHTNKSLYVLTSAISNNLLLRSGFDGIMYPCVPRNGVGYNLALKSEVYENRKIRLENVFRETFVTVKNDNLEKADHVSLLSMEGKLKTNGQIIEW